MQGNGARSICCMIYALQKYELYINRGLSCWQFYYAVLAASRIRLF